MDKNNLDTSKDEITQEKYKDMFGKTDQEGLRPPSHKQEEIRNSFGFAYEFGYNVRAYSALRKRFKCSRGINDNSATRQALDNKELLKSNLLWNLTSELNSPQDKKRYSDYFFNMFYLGCIQGDEKVTSFLDKVDAQRVYYAQMNFANPIGSLMPKLENTVPEYQSKVIKEFLGIDMWNDYHVFNKKGEFLRADSIIAVVDKQGNLHILVTDNKVNLYMGLKSQQNNPVEYLRALKNLGFKKSKNSTFSNLNINTGGLGLDISARLSRYCHATGEKSLLKTIQAGAYADSFLRFLQKHGKLQEFKDKKVYIYALGMADTDTSIIKLSADVASDRREIRNMRTAYKELNRLMDESEKEAIIDDAIHKLLENLNQEKLVTDITKMNREILPVGISEFNLSETIDDFTNIVSDENGISPREENRKAIVEFMESDEEILFLIGCPGIGKTTSVIRFLETLDSYLMLYMSCRLAVNEDFISKQLVNVNGRNVPKYDDAVILFATSYDEKELNGEKINVVNTYIKNQEELKVKSKISFLDANRERVYSTNKDLYGVSDYDNGLRYQPEKGNGVLARLFDGIGQVRDKTSIKKIISTASIQGQKSVGVGTTASKHLIKVFGKAITYNPYTKKYKLNEVEYEKLAERLGYLIVMIDEITGSPEGVSLYKEVKKSLKDLLDDLFMDEKDLERDEYLKELRKKLKIKIIVADANIANSKVIEGHLNSNTSYVKDCIYTSIVEDTSKVKGVSNEYIEDLGRVINVNAYPAKEIEIDYKLFISAQDYKEPSSINRNTVDYDLRKYSCELDEEVNSKLVKNVIDEIISGKSAQTIIYIQNRNRLQVIIDSLTTEAASNGLKIVSGENLIYIASDVSKSVREQYIELINKNEDIDSNILKFVAMTSSASRGLSFKLCNSIHAVLQDTGFEGYLSELMQAIFRPRGNEKYDKEWTKKITFYYGKRISYEGEADFKVRKRKAILEILSYITILRASILTRISGYVKFEDKNLAIVPVGGTYVDAMHESIYLGVSQLLKNIKSERQRVYREKFDDRTKYRIKTFLDHIQESIMTVFGENDLYIGKELGPMKLGDTYRKMLEEWNDDFASILDLDFHPNTFTVNGLLVAKLEGEVTDRMKLLLKDEQKRRALELQLKSLQNYELESVKFEFTDSTKSLAARIQALLIRESFFQNKNSNSLYDTSTSISRYIAVPIYALTSMYDQIVLDGSYEKRAEEEEVTSMREIMERLIKQHAPCGDVSPLSCNYVSKTGVNSVPFISFKSDTLQGIQDSMFDSNYIISSNELNIFNLLSLIKV